MDTTYKLPKQISTMDRPWLRISLLALLVLMAAEPARAQMRPMGMPLTTTIVISKPAPDELYGSKQIVTMGLGTKEYKFVLQDAYVDNAGGRIQWPDIWEQVRTSNPNFVVQGENADSLTKLNPGDVVTIKGMYAPLDRTLEIMFIQPGRGAFEKKQAY
jgi:hypothetical protein